VQLVYTSASQLASALSTHAVELVFRRRIVPPAKAKFRVAYAPSRRMFATNYKPLLEGPLGQRILEFNNARPTRLMFEGGLRYNPYQKGLVCAFDLFWLDYRMISAESCGIVTMEESEFSKQILNEIYGEIDLASAIETTQTPKRTVTTFTPSTEAQRAFEQLEKIKKDVSYVYEAEKRKAMRPKLQLPLSLKTEEERKLFWMYWAHNLQNKSVRWKLAFENK